MAPPPSLKALDGAQFEEAEPWFLEKFLPTLNPFLRDVTTALGGLLDGANIMREDRDIRVVMPAGSGAADAAPFPILLVPQKVRRVEGLVVIRVTPDDATGSPSAAVWPLWELTSKGEVKIRWLSGLDAGATYTVRVRMD